MGFLSIQKIIGSEEDLIICGMDEAGRGPWAGPLVSCALVLKRKCQLPGLKDSKLLTAKKREELYKKLQQVAHIGVGIVDYWEIDEQGLAKAQHISYQRAFTELLEKVDAPIDIALVDGRSKFDVPVKQKAIIKGDKKVRIIACASIIAKVVRDRIMIKEAKKYPQYGFEIHKGYGTKRHQAALKEHGPSPIHRKSFQPIMEML